MQTRATPNLYSIWTGSPVDALRANLDYAAATLVIATWWPRRKKVAPETVADGLRRGQLFFFSFEARFSGYATQLDVFDELVQFSRRCSAATWQKARSSLLRFWASRYEANHAHRYQVEYIKPLALLISTTKPPFKDGRPTAHRPASRANSITAAKAEVLFSTVDVPGSRKARARIFAQVTLITGARPAEWPKARLRPADLTDIEDCYAEYWAIDFTTAKTKQGEVSRTRTLLILSRDVPLVAQFLDMVKAAVARKGHGQRPPYEHFCRDCSTILREAGMKLWPRDRKVITLYPFRNQARAQFANDHGDALTAEMLGHEDRTGRKYYSSSTKAWKASGAPALLTASAQPSVAMRAAAQRHAQEQRERFNARPWLAETTQPQSPAPR